VLPLSFCRVFETASMRGSNKRYAFDARLSERDVVHGA
jgi:hypothetical protein